MTRLAGLLLALVLLPAAPARGGEAVVTAERQIEDRVIELTIATPAFAAARSTTAVPTSLWEA